MSISILKEIIIIQELSLLSATNNNTRCILKLANIYPKEIQTVKGVLKNSKILVETYFEWESMYMYLED